MDVRFRELESLSDFTRATDVLHTHPKEEDKFVRSTDVKQLKSPLESFNSSHNRSLSACVSEKKKEEPSCGLY